MQRLGMSARLSLRLWHLQCRCSAAQRGVVRHAERQTKNTDDGADEPFSLAEGEPEHRSQGQRRQDRQERIPGLAATGRARLSGPGRDRVLREPDGQAAALAQTGLIVRQLVTLWRCRGI
jgi:hypothetical protein